MAGDPERIAMRKVEENGGILYHPNFIKFLVSVLSVEQVLRLFVLL